MKERPILIINLGKPPPSGNHLFSAHWRKKHKYAKEWRANVLSALMVLRSNNVPIPVQDKSELWKLVVKWVCKRPPQDTHPNCCIALKPIVDAIAGTKSMERILWDDDDDHLKLEILKRKSKKGEAETLTFEFYRMEKPGEFDWS